MAAAIGDNYCWGKKDVGLWKDTFLQPEKVPLAQDSHIVMVDGNRKRIPTSPTALQQGPV